MLEFDVSLYRGINDDNFEQKEWQLTVESEENKGKRRVLATGCLNLNEYAASSEPYFQTDITNMKLKPVSTKIKSVTISFSLSCQFLKDGKATLVYIYILSCIFTVVVVVVVVLTKIG
jgi:hypothetical protein